MKTVEAIFEKGVLRPLQPLAIHNGTVVQIVLPEELIASQQAPSPEAVQAFIDVIDSMPLENNEFFSGEDHDETLYGWKQSK